MNKLMLTGRLTRDAVAGATTNGRGYVAFTVAVNRDYKNADGTVSADFIGVMVARPTVDAATKFAAYLKKGTAVEVEGSVRSKTVDLPDGSKNTVLSVVADRVGFALTNASANNTAATPAPAPAPAAMTSTPTPAATPEQREVSEDDLPF